MNKETNLVCFKQNDMKDIVKGAKKVCDAVKSTMGPQGHTVLIRNPFGFDKITKDGVSVAKSIVLKDVFEDIGANAVKTVANLTVNECGDGTTTSSVLAYNILENGYKHLSHKGLNIRNFKLGIDQASAAMVSAINDVKKEISSDEQIINIATISANGDKLIGSLVANAIISVGKYGTVRVEKSEDSNDRFVKIPGMTISRGLLNPHFVTNPASNSAEYSNPVIIMSEGPCPSFSDLLPVFEHAQKLSRPVVVIAEDFDAETLGTFILNKNSGALKIVAVKAPLYGSQMKQKLQDLAALLNVNKIISLDLNNRPEHITIEDLKATGCETVTVSQQKTVFVGGFGQIEQYVEDLKALFDTNKDPFIQDRLNSLTNGVGILSVGAFSETELKEKIDRVDDAVGATKAAIEEGIVPGGGTTLAKLAHHLKNNGTEFNDESFKNGYLAVLDACSMPLYEISRNAGAIPEWIIKNTETLTTLEDFNVGFNANTHNFEDLIESGIIDPAKVERISIQNACSVIGTLLTTNVMIVPEED